MPRPRALEGHLYDGSPIAEDYGDCVRNRRRNLEKALVASPWPNRPGQIRSCRLPGAVRQVMRRHWRLGNCTSQSRTAIVGRLDETRPRREHGAQWLPETVRIPGRVGNEVLEGLIRDGLGHPRQYRQGRFAVAVAEDPLNVYVRSDNNWARWPKHPLKPLQPATRSLHTRGRRRIDHRRTARRSRTKNSMPSRVITRECWWEFIELTKSS